MTKRILLIYDFLTEIGGIERLMSIHAHFLKNAGYEVKLLFGDMDKDLAANEIYKGLDLEEYGSKLLRGPIKLIGGIIGANKLKKIIKPDDVILSYSFTINVTVRKFNNLKINYVNHFPNWLHLPLNERWKWASDPKRKIAFFYSLILGRPTKHLDKKYINDNSLIFTNSDYTKKKIDSLYNIDSIISYPPVSENFTSNYNINTLKKFKLPPTFILSGGRIESYKRYDLLIESYAKIKNKDVPLVITGKWNDVEYRKLKKQIKDLKIPESNVKFIGFVTTEELIHLYSAASVYAMQTPKSDYGYVTAEALCCGCPIVTWGDGGGSQEQTIEGKNGYTAKPYDTAAFAATIDKCLNEDFKRTKFGEILDTTEPFTAEYQEKIFINTINTLLKQND